MKNISSIKYTKQLSAAFIILLLCCSLATKKTVGEYVIEYATAQGIYFKNNTLVSDNNIAIIGANPLPDIRCFNSKGEAMHVFNCMASIVHFIDSVNLGRLSANKEEETLREYLKNNSIQYTDGTPVTTDNIPKREYYVFYSYIYGIDKRIPEDKMKEAWQTLNAAYNKTDTNKVSFYTICITGIAVNDTKFIH